MGAGRWESMTPEEREARRARMQSLSPEDRAAFREQMRQRRAAASEAAGR
jgi:hypothetical protein